MLCIEKCCQKLALQPLSPESPLHLLNSQDPPPSNDLTSDTACDIQLSDVFPLLGEMLCAPASSLPQYPGMVMSILESWQSLACVLGEGWPLGRKRAKEGETAVSKGNSLETNSGGLCFAVSS